MSGEETQDPRVDVELGVTLPVADMGFVKPLIRIRNIDPNLPPDERTKAILVALETSTEAFALIDEHFDVVLSQLIAPETGRPGMKERLEKMEGFAAKAAPAVNAARKNIKALEDRVEKIKQELAALTSERVKND